MLFLIQDGKKKKKKQSKTVGDLIYFDAGQYVTNILHGLFVGFFVLKSLVSICLNNHFVFYSPSAFFFSFSTPYSFLSIHFPIFMLQTGYNRVSKPIKS